METLYYKALRGSLKKLAVTIYAAISVDDTLSPTVSLRVAYRRPHRVPRRVLLVRVGGAKNGRLVEPLCHNLQTNGQRVPGEAAGEGYRGNTGEGGGGREGEMPYLLQRLLLGCQGLLGVLNPGRWRGLIG